MKKLWLKDYSKQDYFLQGYYANSQGGDSLTLPRGVISEAVNYMKTRYDG